MSRRLLATGCLLAAGACALPDWADPIEIIAGPTPKPQRIEVDLPDLRGPYPNLASVPERPPRPSPQAERNRRQAALDRDNAAAPAALAAPADTDPATGPEDPAAGSGPPAGEPPPRAVARRADPRVSAPPDPEPPPPPSRALAPVAAFTTEPTPLSAPPPDQPEVAPGGRPERPETAVPSPDGGLRRDLVGVIYFAPGSAEIDRAERLLLRDVVLLRRQRGGRLRVVGHAAGEPDAGRPPASNGQAGDGRRAVLALSLDRARAVAEGLRDHGLGGAFMELAGAADTAPLYEAGAPTGAAGNRRVEIFLEY